MQGKAVLVRKRRRHSEEFRAQVVVACGQRGVSVAAVALAHGLNANLVRRWIKENAERLSVVQRPRVNPVVESLTVVPVSIFLNNQISIYQAHPLSHHPPDNARM